VLLDRSLRLSEHESALEVGWLLVEMERRFGYALDELSPRFDRSVSWVSRRLALVELLPETIQEQVREGKVAAQVAMKFLVSVARQCPGVGTVAKATHSPRVRALSYAPKIQERFRTTGPRSSPILVPHEQRLVSGWAKKSAASRWSFRTNS
jgi:hypothetical protein